MNRQYVKTIVAVMALCGMSVFSLSPMAAQDEAQRQLTLRIQQARQKMKAAETAKGAERQKLMAEHMNMMQANMEKMREMKPRAGMSAQEREDWIAEHQKLMDDMMGQMMGEHHMMMDGQQMKGMGGGMMEHQHSGGSVDEHKH